jgi:putative ABC transport system ATP-binding protein
VNALRNRGTRQRIEQVVRILTTVMVTHSMRQALDYGTRIIMLHQGHVTLDLSGEEKSAVTMEELLRLFKRKEGLPAAEDELLLT